MPLVFKLGGRRFHFYSNEGDPREPIHVHVDAPDGVAKIWVHPEVKVCRSAGFNSRVLAELVKAVEDRRDEIERAWHDHFGN